MNILAVIIFVSMYFAEFNDL